MWLELNNNQHSYWADTQLSNSAGDILSKTHSPGFPSNTRVGKFFILQSFCYSYTVSPNTLLQFGDQLSNSKISWCCILHPECSQPSTKSQWTDPWCRSPDPTQEASFKVCGHGCLFALIMQTGVWSMMALFRLQPMSERCWGFTWNYSWQTILLV